MKIGELAQVAQCTVETVRFYEKERLLPEPARTSGNFRVYGPVHVERLRFIRNCRALDMSHEQIHTLLGLMDRPAEGCGAIAPSLISTSIMWTNAYRNSTFSNTSLMFCATAAHPIKR